MRCHKCTSHFDTSRDPSSLELDIIGSHRLGQNTRSDKNILLEPARNPKESETSESAQNPVNEIKTHLAGAMPSTTVWATRGCAIVSNPTTVTHASSIRACTMSRAPKRADRKRAVFSGKPRRAITAFLIRSGTRHEVKYVEYPGRLIRRKQDTE